MKQVILIIFALLLTTSAASARDVIDKGAYLGGSVGVTNFDDDSIFDGLDFDDSDTSFEVYGGYKFMKYFAVEARLMSLGSYQVEFIDVDSWAVSIHAVGIIPLGQSNWDLFGQLGLGRINLDAGNIGDDDGNVASAGIGIRFTPTKSVSISLALDGYAWEADAFGQSFDVSISTTKLAVQYNF